MQAAFVAQRLDVNYLDAAAFHADDTPALETTQYPADHFPDRAQLAGDTLVGHAQHRLFTTVLIELPEEKAGHTLFERIEAHLFDQTECRSEVIAQHTQQIMLQGGIVCQTAPEIRRRYGDRPQTAVDLCVNQRGCAEQG